MMNHKNHLDALKAGFKQIEKMGAVALVNKGITRSAGWEHLAEVSAKRGLAEPVGLFWHNQSHSAFEPKTGELFGVLHIYWKGDASRYCDLLRAEGLDVVSPSTEAESIRVLPTPLPGMKRKRLLPLESVAGEALRRVFESPDDDEARISFADALEGHGDPRAAFVRLQVEYATKGTLSKPKFKELALLHTKYTADFFRPLGFNAYGDTSDYCEWGHSYDTNASAWIENDETYAPVLFRSGFVYAVAVPGSEGDWDDDAGAWVITEPAPVPAFDSPWWSTVRRLDLRAPEQLRELLESPVTKRLEVLSVSSEWAGQIGAVVFPAVTKLRVRGGSIDGEVLRQFPVLESLYLSEEVEHGPALSAAATRPNLRQVVFGPANSALTYLRGPNGSFTELRTGPSWPFTLLEDLETVLANFAGRASRDVHQVVLGRRRQMQEKPIERELARIEAFFRKLLPDANIIVEAKSRTSAGGKARAHEDGAKPGKKATPKKSISKASMTKAAPKAHAKRGHPKK